MHLSMNFLEFKPSINSIGKKKKNEFVWYGPIGSKDYYIGKRQCKSPNKLCTHYTGAVRDGANIGKWNVKNDYNTNLDLIGSVVKVHIHEQYKITEQFRYKTTLPKYWWKGTVIGYEPQSGKHTVFFENYGNIKLKMNNGRIFNIEVQPCNRNYRSYTSCQNTNQIIGNDKPNKSLYRLNDYEKEMYRNKWNYEISNSRIWSERLKILNISELKLNRAASIITKSIRNYIKKSDIIDLTGCTYPNKCSGICCTPVVHKVVVKKEKIQRKCNNCNKKAIKKCSGCLKVRYCNEQCQLSDWKEHKINCK